jgi:uracil DNA glycosylase
VAREGGIERDPAEVRCTGGRRFELDLGEDEVLVVGAPGQARAVARLVTAPHHVVLEAPHPSPLSAHRGFFGSRPFSRANAALAEHGIDPVDWRAGYEP